MSGQARGAPYDLERFVEAQRPVYERVVAELRAGAKRSHWMWYIFPQLKGLGSSPMAEEYGILGRDEAAAYIRHPTLGLRLRECTALVNAVKGRPIGAIFGYPDDLKFHSSATLFAHATKDNAVFLAAVKKYFAGEFDPLTMRLLGA